MNNFRSIVYTGDHTINLCRILGALGFFRIEIKFIHKEIRDSTNGHYDCRYYFELEQHNGGAAFRDRYQLIPWNGSIEDFKICVNSMFRGRDPNDTRTFDQRISI